MRLLGLHSLRISEAKLIHRLLTETDKSEETEKKDDKKKKTEPGKPGNLKYKGSPLRKAIEGARMTQAELAKQIDVHPTTISRILHPQDSPDTGREPSYSTIQKVVKALGGSAPKYFRELG